VTEADSLPAAPSWREPIFRRRGTLLAIPALALVTLGRPTGSSIRRGLPLAFAGEALRCWAVGYSGTTTRADHVTAPALVTAGPYAYVRNPLYLGNLLTGLGFARAFGGDARPRSLALAALVAGGMGAVYGAIVPYEEAYLRRTFGASFVDYARRVPAALPRLRPAGPALGAYDPSVIARAETRTFVTFGLMLLALAVRARR